MLLSISADARSPDDVVAFEGREVSLGTIETKIGQNAFQAPTVFNYYHADFSPHGGIGSAGLVAPEAQLTTSPNVINMLNGLSGLIDHGLTRPGDPDSARTFSEQSADFTSEGVLKYRPV